MLRILDITSPDIANGLGIRVTVWVSGCRHKCPNCQNRWTWKYEQGDEVNEIFFTKLKNCADKEYISGLTLSGGDPLYQDKAGLDELKKIITWFKNEYPEKNIWLYTGFTLEELDKPENSDRKEIFSLCDIVVEGRFVENKHNPTLAFRGSENQRIVDVKKYISGKADYLLDDILDK